MLKKWRKKMEEVVTKLALSLGIAWFILTFLLIRHGSNR